MTTTTTTGVDLDSSFVEKTYKPIARTWSAIGQDCGIVTDNEHALELVLDSDRLLNFGGCGYCAALEARTAAAAVKDVLQEHTLEEVVKFLSVHIRLV